MGQDYHYRKIARWEVLAGVRVPVDEDGNYLNQDAARSEAKRKDATP